MEKTRKLSMSSTQLLELNIDSISITYHSYLSLSCSWCCKSRNKPLIHTVDCTTNVAAKAGYEPTTDEKWLQRAIFSMIRRTRFKCAVCQEKFAVGQGADNHLHEQYGKGGRDSTKHREFMFAVAALNSSGTMPGQGMW